MFTDTITKDVFIDDLTAAGSAFGSTADGEAVFVNARIVEAVKIKAGDYIKAIVIPNYEDKRHRVQWRAVRAEVTGSAFEDISAEPDDEKPLVSRDVQVVGLLEEFGPLRTATLARLMNTNSGEIGTLCHGLYAQGKIALADVYSGPGNKRASHRVWAVDINEFDVDPFDVEE
jgi:hypothetical protein